MAKIDFKSLFEKLKEEVTALAVSAVKNRTEEAKADALNLLQEMKANLEAWTVLYAAGRLSKEDMEYLILGQKEVIEMNALKQVGISMVRLDELKTGMLKAILGVITGSK